MTTYKKNVYKGYSFTYTIKKEKYWDKAVTKSISANTVDNVTLEPYDGVTIAYNAPVVNISDGQLPDGIPFDAYVGYPNGAYGSEYLVNNALIPGIALDWGVNDSGGEHTDFYYCPDNTVAMRHYDTAELPDGAVWIGELNNKFILHNITYKANFAQVGDVIYSGEVASLAETSALKANKNTPTINEYFPVNIDFITKVNASLLGSYKVILRNTTNVHFGMYNQTWYISDNSRATGGTAELNKTYWVRVVQTAQTSAFTTALYYMEDDGTYTINALPAVSNTNWTKAFEVAKQAFMNNEAFSLGDSGGTGSFTGTIDLANTMMRTFTGTAEPTYTLYWKPLGEI